MRVVVPGGTGSYIVPELIGAGHEVAALARSETAAATVAALGAEVSRGDIQDLSSLEAGWTRAATTRQPRAHRATSAQHPPQDSSIFSST